MKLGATRTITRHGQWLRSFFGQTKTTEITEARERIRAAARSALISKDFESEDQPPRHRSFYGGSFYGLPDETWPRFEGRPLLPWVYISRASLPDVPDRFRDFAGLAFYIDDQLFTGDYVAKEGSQLVVREYRSVDELVLLARPETLEDHPAYLLEWTKADDFPSLSHFYSEFSEEVYQHFCDHDAAEGLANHSGIKIGGWPTLVQRNYDTFDLDELKLQIDATENFMYADSGIVYVTRLNDGRWYFEFDCC